MSSAAFPPKRTSSLSPPRPQPSQYASLNNSLNTSPPKPLPPVGSPIRRKPLPAGAFSPPTPISQIGSATSRNNGQRPRAETDPAVVDGPRVSGSRDPKTFIRSLHRPVQHQPTRPRPFITNRDTLEHPNQSAIPVVLQQATHSRFTSDPIATRQITNGHPTSTPRSRSNTMALMPPSRPPPLRLDSFTRSFSSTTNENKKPQTPGSKISSFFGWKQSASPETDSTATEISEPGRSPMPSPLATSPQTSSYSSRPGPAAPVMTKANGEINSTNHFGGPLVQHQKSGSDMSVKVGQLEGELREISCELAGSIRRELELEDMIERLQLELSQGSDSANRTSDYFSDPGINSLRLPGDSKPKGDVEKLKRDLEQQRAQLKVDVSQKWQDERARRKELESHVQLLEGQVSQLRRSQVDTSALSLRAKELETSLEDARRRIAEERQLKENFEDLLTALKVNLEQTQNERDNLRDKVVPQLKAQPNGNSVRFGSIAEEGTLSHSRRASVTRSQGIGRSGSISRSNSISGRNPNESLADKMKDIELQRDTLHAAVRSLLIRQAHQTRENQKKMRILEAERDRALQASSTRKLGYEKEVRGLRGEINYLRQRADDALQQKLQCEKGLGGLKMDLDRSKQETGSLQPEQLSSTLQQAYNQLQQDHKQAYAMRPRDSSRSLQEERRLAAQLKESAERSEELASLVRQQLGTNDSLRNRLVEAVARGAKNQDASATQITELQSRLRKLEDTVTLAQTQSEIAVMRHEEEIRVLTASHNAQLLRAKAGVRSSTLFSPARTPRTPLSPMFANRGKSPRLDKTSSGPGIALSQALKTEHLETKVGELEKALSEADREMQEVVQRMNYAQIEVAELQSERDEALKQTRRLQAAILAEREKVQSLIKAGPRS